MNQMPIIGRHIAQGESLVIAAEANGAEAQLPDGVQEVSHDEPAWTDRVFQCASQNPRPDCEPPPRKIRPKPIFAGIDGLRPEPETERAEQRSEQG